MMVDPEVVSMNPLPSSIGAGMKPFGEMIRYRWSLNGMWSVVRLFEILICPKSNTLCKANKISRMLFSNFIND
jgi:hypothetical protein